MTKFFTRINAALEARGLDREEGQGAVEYALVLGVLVVGIFGFWVIADVGSVITDAIAAVGDLL